MRALSSPFFTTSRPESLGPILSVGCSRFHRSRIGWCYSFVFGPTQPYMVAVIASGVWPLRPSAGGVQPDAMQVRINAGQAIIQRQPVAFAKVGHCVHLGEVTAYGRRFRRKRIDLPRPLWSGIVDNGEGKITVGQAGCVLR